MKKKIGAIIMASALCATMAGTAALATTDTTTTQIPTDPQIMASTRARLVKDSEIICYIGEGQVTASVLNVRSGPGTNYGVRAQLKKGTWVSLYCTTKDKTGWWYIIKGNTDGFVSDKYIGNVDPASLTEES